MELPNMLFLVWCESTCSILSLADPFPINNMCSYLSVPSVDWYFSLGWCGDGTPKAQQCCDVARSLLCWLTLSERFVEVIKSRCAGRFQPSTLVREVRAVGGTERGKR